MAPAVSIALAVPGDALGGAALALTRATYRAREGGAAAAAVQLAEAFGWLPPVTGGADGGMGAPPAAARPAACTAAGPAVGQAGRSSVDVDEHGREISPYLRRRPPDRLDAYPGVFPYSR